MCELDRRGVMNIRARCTGWILGGFLLWTDAPAPAANLQISPVMITLRAGQGATGIAMQNLSESPVYGQVRVFLWEQKDGDDVLTPTQEVVPSPPIIQIAPKSSQVIRLVRRSEQPATRELSYRILIDEIPREDKAAGSGVDIRLRYSVPMFVLPPDERGAPALAWAVFRKDGAWMLRVRNSGNQRAQIGALELSNAAGKQFVLAQGLFGYVLSGQLREWRLPTPGDADLQGRLAIKANINMQAQTAVTVDQVD
ncbi:fimbrial biogenesis chaperone [Janthinobacterium sp. HH01]|uniref:fimbrial biogenesis chaperone n=1 Tax=Janthinobacterium sp. HH01 TaxID=1198452 RepID=UPI00034B639B|nr:molecular chaperone [Janthinobacterium sp. HH01]